MSTRVPREKAVFVEALEMADPEQRSQFLDQACGADQALREQVENMLLRFLDKPIAADRYPGVESCFPQCFSKEAASEFLDFHVCQGTG